MIKNFTCLFFALLSMTFVLCGQDVDALLDQLESVRGTQRVDLLNQLVEATRFADTDAARSYAEDAYTLSIDLDYPKGIVHSAFYLGIVERDADNLRKAQKYAEEGLEAAQALGVQTLELEGWSLLKTIYRLRNGHKRKYQEAELAYMKLKSKIDQAQSKTELEALETEVKQAAQFNEQISREVDQVKDTLAQTLAEKRRQKERLERLELRKQLLERDSALLNREIQIQEYKIQQYDASLQFQQFLVFVLVVGLIAASIMAFVVYQNYRLQQLRQSEKEKAQRQLMVQEKMASLGQLTAGIAHEIKNPLNFVNNFAEGSKELAAELEEELTQMNGQPNPEQMELLTALALDLKQNSEDISTNGKRIDRIVQSMMAHASGNKGELQSVSINDLVKENLNLAYHGYRGMHATFSAAIEEEYDDTVPPIKAVPQDLSRALLNIIGNACYALHEKQQREIPNYISSLKVSTQRQNGEVVISIRDNGPGIPEEVKEKIFLPFFTTKPTGEGNSGLGLSISNDIIVQGHHGKLEVNTEPDVFTEFLIRLPVV